jgi:hypothetical protein
MSEINSSVSMSSPEEKASEISTRIKMLCDMSDADLKTEMQSLKAAIMQNPAATSLLLPEDIGQMVAALRRITGFAIQQATTKPKKAAKPRNTPMSAEQLAAALDDDDF